MTGGELRTGRKQRGWTQTELAERLGVSQGYVCLLERAQRPVAAALAQKATRLLGLPATALPLGSTSTALADDAVTTALATLGYPGFAYRRRRRQSLNPAELLLRALKTADLDARVVEALVWVALTYAELDWDWLVRQAKLDDLQNRLGFLVTLARQLAEQRENAEASARLARAEQALEYSRLQREDAFRLSMTEAERKWLRQHRSPEATRWNVLTNLNASELARGF
jgi:transcriptional regulator with XRE-family HTH domain